MIVIMYYLIAINKIVHQSQECLTYSSQQKLAVGQIVAVPIGNKTTIGVVLKSVSKPNFATKEATIIEPKPLPNYLIKAFLWLKDYYLSPLASVIQTALPTGITKTRRTKVRLSTSSQKIFLKPTTLQQQVIDTILDKNQTYLLHGITGSGKTTVYLELAKKIIEQGKSVLLIIPEISLTTQLHQQFLNYFDNVLVQHSAQTEAIRHVNWQFCLNNHQPLIVIGTRSSLFMPIHNLGLIVIDEFHEVNSLKQAQNPKYLATRLASKISQDLKIPLVLGSATPSVADYWLAEQKSCSIIKLDRKARQTRLPNLQLIDLRQKTNFSQHYLFSNQLLKSIRNSLKNKHQILLFHNRRGSASATICTNCGWVAECPHCHIPLVLHQDDYQLKCHTCSHHQPVPTACPQCHQASLEHRGFGTKLIEFEIKKLFPDAKIKRFDADTPKQEQIAQTYQELKNGEVDIMIGTQVIAKGLNLDNLTTVGIIQADAGLFMPDFNAHEKTFQLLTQVIGRIGRNQNETEAIVQTYYPDHYVIQAGLNQNFDQFYQQEIKLLKKHDYPPFTFLLKLRINYKTEAVVIKHAQNLTHKIKNDFPAVQIFGPTPTFYEKMNNLITWQLIIKSKQRQTLQDIIKILPLNQHWQFDIDPIGLL